VLVLAIVALEVPLVINLRDRIDAEVKSEARSQAEFIAATVDPNRPRELRAVVKRAAGRLRGRVIVVGPDGRLLADSAGQDRLGADDYVVKPFSGAEVIARMRAVLRRVKPSAPAVTDLEVGPLRVERGARRVFLDGGELALSRKEFDLLVELMSHAGEVVTREDLMSRVWDENWFGSTKTLDVHVRWLRQKLDDAPDDPRYLHTVRGVGFRFTAPEEWGER
jgi:two-component system response regulator RegX3